MPARRTGRIFSPLLRSQRPSLPPSLSLCITSGRVNESMEIGSYHPGWVGSGSFGKYGLLRSRDATLRVRNGREHSLASGTHTAASRSKRGWTEYVHPRGERREHERRSARFDAERPKGSASERSQRPLAQSVSAGSKGDLDLPRARPFGGRRLADTAG